MAGNLFDGIPVLACGAESPIHFNLALEASYTVASNDIRRAVRNAGYVNALTGLSAYAAVTGVQILPEAQAEIDAGQVLFYQIPAREMQSE